jgi:tungstate transport system substrate-binding protein
VIVGPRPDPAGLNHSANVSVVFQKIHDNGTAGLIDFVSRGDSSGTHAKELTIWKSIGLNASTFSNDWYISPGAGMGAVLDMCEQTDAYTLSDDATYYQRQSENLIPSLNIVYNHQKSDSTLRNQYSVIVLNETRFPHINHTMATSFKEWLVSQEGQDLIASYERYNQQLFIPNAVGYVSSSSSLSAVNLVADVESGTLAATYVRATTSTARETVTGEARWSARQDWN